MVDTYGKTIQLKASRQRLKDAHALHSCNRFTGAMYMGGYAVECSLKALICDLERQWNLKETRAYKERLHKYDLHRLSALLDCTPDLQRAISLDITGKYKESWKLVSKIWINDSLRYSETEGDKNESEKFIAAVVMLHRYILEEQGEAP